MADERRSQRYEEDESRWSEWMRRAHGGDTDAYRRLLEELSGAIERYLRARLGDGPFVEDCVQESLLALHKARASYDPRRPFRPWMFAIVRHKAIDLMRRRGTRERYEVDAEHESAPDRLPEPGAALEAARLLEELEPKYREALVMTKLEGRSLAEAAEVAGVSVGAMKTRVHRAIRLVQGIMEREPV